MLATTVFQNHPRFPSRASDGRAPSSSDVLPGRLPVLTQLLPVERRKEMEWSGVEKSNNDGDVAVDSLSSANPD